MPHRPVPAPRSNGPGRAAAAVLVAAAALLLAALLAPAAPAAAAEGDGDRQASAAERAPVILYMTDWCGWCRKTRALLHEIEADFEEVDIEKSDEGRREYEEKSGGRGGVPLLDIGGTIVRGYDEPRIRRLVAELKQGSDRA
jgi:glutaredoxin